MPKFGLKPFLYVIGFVSGVVVMAMEISFSRLLAPYFGTSLFLWTNLIGAILVGLAVGYYLGGYLAELRPQLDLLLKLLFGAGIVFALVPSLIDWLGAQAATLWQANHDLGLFLVWWGIAVTILVLPIAVLGMASPYLMKIYSLQNSQFGRVSGGISFAFTVGSILGTYLPTFWLIPNYGTHATILGFASLLIVMGAVGWSENWLRVILLLAGIGLVAAVWGQPLLNFGSGLKLLVQKESLYNFIRVLEDKSGNRYLIYNVGIGIQSLYSPQRILTGFYYDYYNLLPALVPAHQRPKVLLLGLAGGTILRQLQHFYGNNIELTAVEIDPSVIVLSRSYFGLNDVAVKVINQDARVFLQTQQGQYDIIIVDAYQNEFEIPWTLATQEFWHLVHSRLSSDGVVASNVIGSTQQNKLAEAIANTQASVFANTYTGAFSEAHGQNEMIVSANHPVDFLTLPSELVPQLRSLAQTWARDLNTVAYDPHQPVLTDDRAPVEILTSAMVLGGGRR
jgi:spermidine synthase